MADYNSIHTGLEVDDAVTWVKANPAALAMLLALMNGDGNCRMHPVTFNLQLSPDSGASDPQWHDLEVEDQGGYLVPVINQIADPD